MSHPRATSSAPQRLGWNDGLPQAAAQRAARSPGRFDT